MNIDMQNLNQDEIQDIKKEFYLLCKSIKDKSVSRNMLIAYANSYIVSQNLNNEESNGKDK